MYPFDALWDSTGDVTKARIGRELATQLANHDALLSTMYHQTPPAMSDNDVRRIAEAVVDEQERRAAHPLRVTAADVRRWIR